MAKIIQPEIVYLSNGIPVVLQSDDSLVAATYWWVKTGSCDENPEEAGFAHFLEHMLFKDAAAKETGKASSGKVARAIESLGGDINAYTSFDQTVYHVTCAAQHWEKVLGIFSSIAKPQAFLKQDFEREREVILEELRKNEDSPSRQLFQSLFSTTFKKHPYGRPVIGYEKILKAAKVSQLEKFYRRNYVSDRMGLVLVGPLGGELPGQKSETGKKKSKSKLNSRKKSILKLLEKAFGKSVLPRKASVSIPRQIEPVFNSEGISSSSSAGRSVKPNWVVRSFQVKTPTLSFSFRVPELSHEDIPALDLLSGILGMGELSRLYQRLFYQTSLVTDIASGLYVPNDPGMFYLQADLPSMDVINSASEEIFKEIKKLATEGPTAEEMTRVMVHAESERLYAVQTVDGAAGRLGFLQFTVGDINHDRDYLEQLREVGPDRIKQVAKQYLDFRRMSSVLLVPEAEAGFDFRVAEENAKKLLSPEPLPGTDTNSVISPVLARSKSKNASTRFFELPSGLQFCIHRRPTSQIFSIHASALGGTRLELNQSPDLWGASHLMSNAWTKGTSSMNAHQISKWVEGRAAGLDGFSGRNSVGLQMTALNRDWNQLSSLFSEVLLDPVFPDDEMEHVKRVAEDSIKGIEDHSAQLCSKLFLESLFSNHPYGKMIYGSLDSLAGIDSEKIRTLHRGWMSPERLVISISGNISDQALEKFIHELDQKVVKFAEKHRASQAQRTPSLGMQTSEPPLKAPRWVEKALGREQAHILVGGLGIKITSEDRIPLQLLQTLLGGQSGRLFIELREKKSLAYSVSPVSFEGVEPGYLGTYIACAQEKRENAIQGIQQVLENLSIRGPSGSEMKRAKEFFLGRRAMDLQGDTSLAAHLGLEKLYGLPYLSEQDLIRKVNGVSSRDLKKICRKYFVEPYMVTCVVG